MRLRTSVYGLIEYWRVGGTGRRRGLKNPREQSHIGSIPIPATIWHLPQKHCKTSPQGAQSGPRLILEKKSKFTHFLPQFPVYAR